MVETEQVTQKTIGYSWSISVKKEHREETGAKYPDKTVSKAGFSGHTDTYEEAVVELKEAKKELRADG